MLTCGAITGSAGAAIGAGSVLCLGSAMGSIAGLVAGAAVGGLVIWLASKRLLRDATACLAALGALEADHTPGTREMDADRPLPVLGSAAFDAWIAHLYDLLAHLRRVQSEYAGAEQLVRRLGDTINGSRGSKECSVSLESGAEGAAQPLLVFLDQFRRSALQINRDVSALEEANERVASGAHDQSEAVSRTATSVEALSDRIDRIARNAGEAADACESARQEAQQGLEQVHSVIEGMDRLLSRIEANGRKVRRLDDRSTEIGVIVELIRGISSRTDMLALNATIESIRAGEHGRGFAIVAEEIRKLAERAAVATREIGTLVEAIQADTQESIRALSEEQAQTQRESQRIRETGTSLARIRQVVEKSARLVEGISRSTNDQVLTTQDLVRAMQRISDVTQQTQERTTQARGFISALNQSCEPWQRLAAVDPVPDDSASRPAGAGLQLPEGLRPLGAGLMTPALFGSSRTISSASIRSPHGSSKVRQNPGRKGVGSEHSR
jgi:methyl-accepting chemotaxis protein